MRVHTIHTRQHRAIIQHFKLNAFCTDWVCSAHTSSCILCSHSRQAIHNVSQSARSGRDLFGSVASAWLWLVNTLVRCRLFKSMLQARNIRHSLELKLTTALNLRIYTSLTNMLGIRAMELQRENIIPSRRACRSLFGPVDHEEVKKTLAREMDVLDSRMKMKYNFDFKNETPLAGKFHWERVTPVDTRVPVAYKVMLSSLEPKEEESSDEEDVPSVPVVDTVEPSSSTTTTTTPLPENCESRQMENETTPPAPKPVSRKRKRSGQSAITGKLDTL